MKRVIVMFLAVLMAVGAASAATVWNPAGNTVNPGSQAWGDPDNWTGGAVPGTGDKVVYNVPDAADCQVSGSFSGMQIVQGDNGPGGTLSILSGGVISTNPNQWTAIGYNDLAHTIVDAGGSFTFGQHAWIGFGTGSNGTLDVSGYVRVNGMLGLGWNGGDGYVNVNDGGVLDLHQLHGDGSSSVKQNSLLSINGTGKILLPGDVTSMIADYAANGLIAGNGIIGNVQVDVVDDSSIVTAVPEPATMLLLGLGGLLIRKRK